ncbi:MAG: Na(+)/H(+) antiporter subunit B [Candidatus Cloacimonetes bacterium]|jgi:multicomponent Na+:H+ antiporter subunit B|nr:Na(+)/H(+) antiporter subunit B [Candidatus Cloacimonadota bacterium]MBT4332522.1 Na(+)/H(+) antiporter subunit B [Candidatus Cloacimonadota bacterium]
MIKRVFILLAILGLVLMFLPFLKDFDFHEELGVLSSKYVEGSVNDLNTQNVVTAVIVTYRGLDTLGEVTVLFLATAGVGFLLRKKKTSEKSRKSSELLQTGSQFLFVLIVLTGVYIFTHGHLTPGGGFQGGVLITTAFLLLILADTNLKFNHRILLFVESFSGAFYVIIGLLGVLLIGMNSFLDPTILPIGNFGKLLSAGAIPLIYSLIGLKVGSELTTIIDKMGGE